MAYSIYDDMTGSRLDAHIPTRARAINAAVRYISREGLSVTILKDGKRDVDATGEAYERVEDAGGMGIAPNAIFIKPHGDYAHVDFRPGDQFTEIRTPKWASRVANSSVSGALVRMGKEADGGWLIQSILIPLDKSDDPAEIAKMAIMIEEKLRRKSEASMNGLGGAAEEIIGMG